jgi:twitching motility protein PilT
MSQFNIINFLPQIVAKRISDIHLKIGESPIFRKDGLMTRTELPPLTEEDMNRIIQTIVPAKTKVMIDHIFDADFLYQLEGVSRFRVNLCREMGKISFVLRVVPFQAPTCDDINLPKGIKNLTKFNNGIILVTGPTGSGKSTTLAALLDYINQTAQKHIITIEDPIEFVHSNKKSIFTQRQLSVDTPSFSDGLKYALRQDPDVILIGEMRDRETMMSALKAAETGHLVFSTLHTIDAVQTVNRIINSFEPHEREAIKFQLAESLRGTIAQKLVKRANNEGRIPAAEILIITPAVRDYIEKDKLDCVYELIKQGSFNDMITMNMSLYRLVKAGLITKEEAIKSSDNKNELEQMLKGVFYGSFEKDEAIDD